MNDKLVFGSLALGGLVGIMLAKVRANTPSPPAWVQNYVDSLFISITAPRFEGQQLGRPMFLLRLQSGPYIFNYWAVLFQSTPDQPEPSEILGFIKTWSIDSEASVMFGFYAIAGNDFDVVDKIGNTAHATFAQGVIGPFKAV